jgi:glycosyltransferase involved in cell wall biosynthesis
MARILVLTNMYPPHHFGGYELICADVVERWRASGHEVTVLTGNQRVEGVADPSGESGGSVRRVLELYYRDQLVIRPPIPRRFAIERHNQRALTGALADARPEVISVWHMGALSLGLLATIASRDIPMVFVLGDLWPWYGPEVDAWLRLFANRRHVGRWVERLTGLPAAVPDLSGSGATCYASDWLRRELTQNASWMPARAGVTHHGIDRAIFRPPDDGDRPWRWRLLVAGRLDDRKGVHVAVEALAHLPPEATLTIIGRGDERYRTRLDRLAADLGVSERVRFDVATRTELSSRYGDADVLLFPVLWDEPFGLVPIEAMACGTPVIATGTGGSSEFLLDEANCLLAAKGDAEATARAVTRLASDAALRSRIVSGGFATAELFDVDHCAEQLGRWHAAAVARFRDGLPESPPDAATQLRERGVRPG